MSQTKLAAKKALKTTDAQTPAPKLRCPECPPAPVKGESGTDIPGASRQTLTPGQIRQLRKSWSDATERTLEDQ